MAKVKHVQPAKYKSELEMVKAETMRAVRAYYKVMDREFGRIADELGDLYDEDVDEPKIKRRIERLEREERRHAEHLEKVIDILRQLEPDDSSYV